MQITRWAQRRRRLPPADASEFFDQPLREFELFHFVTSDLVVPRHGGHLSLKFVLAGEEQYRVGNRSIVLAPGRILFTNAGDEYASVVERQTEALSLFIPDGEALTILAAFRGDAVLLDGVGATGRLPSLPRVPFAASPALWRTCVALRALDADDPDAAVDCARLLTDAAMRACLAIAPASPFADVVRVSVREELMTRLLRARDRLHDDGCAVPTLASLAEISCLSPYHFLRRFKEAFGMTPGAYARKLRLDRARHAIARGGSLRAAAARAGYTSMEAFSRALRRRS